MSITKEKVMKKLAEVIDPELGISIVDMGFIYQIEIADKKVKILMTLTTTGCPLFSMIENDIKTKIRELGASEVEIELTFDPPWSMDRMTKKGRKKLGF